MNKTSLFFVFSLLFLTMSCSGAGRNIGSLPCSISDYSFFGNDKGEIILTFKDNMACQYKLSPGADRSWIIYIPNAYMADISPRSDEFANMNINKIRRTEAGIEIYFNSHFGAYEKPYSSSIYATEGSKVFVFKKEKASLPEKKGENITGVFCLADPFILRVDSDGAIAYGFGNLGLNKSYVDIIDAKLSDNFSIPPQCEELIKISEIDFPKRTRIIVDNAEALNFDVYAEGASLYAEMSATKKSGKNFYMLGMDEDISDTAQVLHFHTSIDIAPSASVQKDSSVIVNLEKNFTPVSLMGKNLKLQGPVFSEVKISDKGDKIVLSALNSSLDAEFCLQKTNNGFIIYSKLL